MPMKGPKILVEPPGPKAREFIERDSRITSPSLTRTAPLVGVEGEGSFVKDIDGNVYLDFGTGIAVASLGHRHPAVVKAIEDQLKKVIFVNSHDYLTVPYVELAERLAEVTPGDFPKRVFFGNSGSEAVECALKLVVAHTKRPYIIGFIGGFHGRTAGALPFTTTSPAARRYFEPLFGSTMVHAPFGYCYRCPFGHKGPEECGFACLDYLEKWILARVAPPDRVAGIIFEPIQGAGGYIVPPDGWLRRLEEIARNNDIPLIDDEVQTGLGKTGKWFAVDHEGVVPDVIAISKNLAAGLPLGACVGRSELWDWDPGAHENTLGGNPLACAAGVAVVETIKKENLLERARSMGAYLKGRFVEMMESHEIIGDVRGRGMMIGIELVKDRKTKEYAKQERNDLIMEAFKRGLLILGAGPSSIRLAPPLTLSKEEADEGLRIFEEALKAVELKHGYRS